MLPGDPVARITLLHVHLVSLTISAGRRQNQFLPTVQKLNRPMPNSPCIPVPPSAFSRLLIESQICVATYSKSGRPNSLRRMPSPSSLIRKKCIPCSLPRTSVTRLARASMLFSTNSATAFSGLLCERAIMRIAFQLSPMRNLPESAVFNAVINAFLSRRNQVRNVGANEAQPCPRWNRLSSFA